MKFKDYINENQNSTKIFDFMKSWRIQYDSDSL
jgi:hypothetical protein